MKNLKEIKVTELKKNENKEIAGGITKLKVEPIVEPLNPVLDLLTKPYYLG